MKTTDDQKELFIVVDEFDKILGYRTRAECHRDKSLIHRVVGLILYDSEGKLLLQKRSLSKDMEAGKWSIAVAGHVRKGQTYEEAMQRELSEELGISTSFKLLCKFIYNGEDETEMSTIYKGISDGPFYPDKTEISQIKLFSPDEIRLGVTDGSLDLSESAIINLTQAGILK
jgi:isopentenyldiphosphate isomerase